jgi:hypothetical protein
MNNHTIQLVQIFGTSQTPFTLSLDLLSSPLATLLSTLLLAVLAVLAVLSVLLSVLALASPPLLVATLAGVHVE